MVKLFWRKGIWLLLICRYSEDLGIEDAVHTAILTLKEGFEGQLTENNVEIGIIDDKGLSFKKLGKTEIKDLLANIA